MMRWFTPLVAVALLMSACAAGPNVSDDFDDDVFSVEDPMTSATPGSAQQDVETGTSVEPEGSTESAQDDPTSPDTDASPTLTTHPPKDPPTSTTTSTSNPVAASSGAGSVDPGLLPLADQAAADLASRLSIDTSTIALVSAELVEWPDTSLGCPLPGMVYQPVLTDGSLIILSHDGVEYRYHTGGDVYVPFLCE